MDRINLNMALASKDSLEQRLAAEKVNLLLPSLEKGRMIKVGLTAEVLRDNSPDQSLEYGIGHSIHQHFRNDIETIIPLKKRLSSYLKNPAVEDGIDPKKANTYKDLVSILADAVAESYCRLKTLSIYPETKLYFLTEFSRIPKSQHFTVEEVIQMNCYWLDRSPARTYPGYLDYLRDPLLQFCENLGLMEKRLVTSRKVIMEFRIHVKRLLLANGLLETIHDNTSLEENNLLSYFQRGQNSRIKRSSDTLKDFLHKLIKKHKVEKPTAKDLLVQIYAEGILERFKQYQYSLSSASEQNPLPTIIPLALKQRPAPLQTPNDDSDEELFEIEIPNNAPVNDNTPPLVVKELKCVNPMRSGLNELTRDGKAVSRAISRLLNKTPMKEITMKTRQLSGSLDPNRIVQSHLTDAVFKSYSLPEATVRNNILVGVDSSSSLNPDQVQDIKVCLSGLTTYARSRPGTKVHIATYYSVEVDERNGSEKVRVDWIRYGSRGSSYSGVMTLLNSLHAQGKNWDKASLNQILTNHQMEGAISLFILSDGKFRGTTRSSGLQDVLHILKTLPSTISAKFLGFDADPSSCEEIAKIGIPVVEFSSGQKNVGEAIAKTIVSSQTKKR